MPQLQHPSRNTGETIDFAFWISSKVRRGSGEGHWARCYIFPFHTALSDLHQRILELKGLWRWFKSISIHLQIKKEWWVIRLKPQLIIDREGVQSPLPCLLLCFHWKSSFMYLSRNELQVMVLRHGWSSNLAINLKKNKNKNKTHTHTHTQIAKSHSIS